VLFAIKIYDRETHKDESAQINFICPIRVQLSGEIMTISPVILITGASSGIGEASARLFAQKGYRVVLAARRMERLQSLAEEIQSAGGEALPVATDVTQLDQLENLVSTAIQEYGQIDVLLNNAGFGHMNWLEKMDPQRDIESQLQVNLHGVIHTTRLVLPHMLARRQGHIINMASIAALIATPTYSIYAATKFGLKGFTEGLRREVGAMGIHVSGIYPGGVATEFADHTGRKPGTKITTPKAIKLSSEDVAQTVWRVVQRPRRSVVIPRIMLPAVWLNTLFPGLVDWGIGRFFTRAQRKL
jgi:short-subunit dehydrogenase